MIKLEYSPENDHFILKKDGSGVVLSQEEALELLRLLKVTPYLNDKHTDIKAS